MKALKITFVVLCMLIAMVAGSVYADVEVADVTLGDSGQERGEDAPSETFTIRNTFNESVTINSITTSADAAYDLTVSGVTLPQVIASGGSITATLNGFVPESHDSVEQGSLDEGAIGIGSVNVAFTQASGPTGTTSNQVSMQAENGLEISDADIEITGMDETTSGVDDGDDFDVSPGDSFRIEVQIENTFNEDVDIEDIRVTMDIEDDRDFDADDDSETIDLDAGDDDIVSFIVDIDEEADDGSHQVTITVEGEDENGALHADVLEFEINIDRERHDVRIDRLTVSPERLLCQLTATNEVEVEVRMVNRGQDDEREAAIEVSAPTLGNFRERADDIELDQDESATRRFIIAVPEGVNSGSHRITARTFFSNDIAQDVQEAIVTVEACAQEPQQEPTQPNQTPQPPVVSTPPVVTQPPSGSGTVSATPTSAGFTDSLGYVIVLVALIVVVGGAVLGLGAYLLLRK